MLVDLTGFAIPWSSAERVRSMVEPAPVTFDGVAGRFGLDWILADAATLQVQLETTNDGEAECIAGTAVAVPVLAQLDADVDGLVAAVRKTWEFDSADWITYEDEVLLGTKLGANLNVTTDQAISLTGRPAGYFEVTRIVVTNASTSLTTAAGGVYATTAKGGTAIVAASQVYSALVAPEDSVDLTVTTVLRRYNGATQANFYLALTTAQGAAATADVRVYGRAINPCRLEIEHPDFLGRGFVRVRAAKVTGTGTSTLAVKFQDRGGFVR